MKENKKDRKPHVLRTADGTDTPINWSDIALTAEVENGQNVYQLKGTGTKGFKVHKLELDEEQEKRVHVLLDWLNTVDIPDGPKSGLEALMDAWKE